MSLATSLRRLWAWTYMDHHPRREYMVWGGTRTLGKMKEVRKGSGVEMNCGGYSSIRIRCSMVLKELQ